MENLEINSVNFSDPESMAAFATLLGSHASEAGLLTPGGGSNPTASKLRAAAREWISRTDAVVDTLTPSGAFTVMSAYDLVHRIAYGKPAFPDVINRHVLRAFDAMIRGDRAVNRYAMFRHIAAALSRKDRAYLGKPLQWYGITLDRWHTQFRLGTSSTHISTYDTLEIVSILLETDLWLLETRNEAAYKHRLVAKTLPLITSLITASQPQNPITPQLQNPSTSQPLQAALSRFLSASSPYLPSSLHNAS